MSDIIPAETIINKIYFFRGIKVMLDRDLAELYGVETRRLNEQVKRNLNRFPDDFMFQLNKEEFQNWISHFATSNSEKMGLRKLPYAFTEHGILMLSNVLNSERAVNVSIQIIRTFTRLRDMLSTNADLKKKIEHMEKKYDENFRIVFETLKQLLSEEIKPKKKIGFTQNEK